MQRTTKTRVIVSKNYSCYRLHVKLRDVQKMGLGHLQKLNIFFPEKKVKFNSKITSSSKRVSWRVHVPLIKAKEAQLSPRMEIKAIFKTM